MDSEGEQNAGCTFPFVLALFAGNWIDGDNPKVYGQCHYTLALHAGPGTPLNTSDILWSKFAIIWLRDAWSSICSVQVRLARLLLKRSMSSLDHRELTRAIQAPAQYRPVLSWWCSSSNYRIAFETYACRKPANQSSDLLLIEISKVCGCFWQTMELQSYRSSLTRTPSQTLKHTLQSIVTCRKQLRPDWRIQRRP